HGMARQAGFATKTALTSPQAVSLLEKEPFAWAIVDLELPQVDLSAIVAAAKAIAARTVAFGPHVQSDLLDKALAAGFDLVLTRGQISSSLGRVLTAQPS